MGKQSAQGAIAAKQSLKIASVAMNFVGNLT